MGKCQVPGSCLEGTSVNGKSGEGQGQGTNAALKAEMCAVIPFR